MNIDHNEPASPVEQPPMHRLRKRKSDFMEEIEQPPIHQLSHRKDKIMEEIHAVSILRFLKDGPVKTELFNRSLRIHTPKWILCVDAKPEPKLLVALYHGGAIHCGFLINTYDSTDPHDWEWHLNNYHDIVWGVDFWAPLPNMPNVD